ncbi:MAG: tetratricopeptide repeat protein, partial [Armatimonadota bacterium]
AETDDEVATVIGHEWGHIEKRHSIRALKKHLIWSTIAQFALAKQSRLTQNVGILGLNLGMLKSSRKDELQADRKGVELPYQTGYDPNAEVAFFNRLMEKRKHKPSRLEVYLMTHPALETRIARIRKRPELDPDNPQAQVVIGTGYLARYRVAEAIAHLERAVELDGRAFEARKSLGDAYRLIGDRDRAAEQYRAALAIQADEETRDRLAALQEADAGASALSEARSADPETVRATASQAADAMETVAAARVAVSKRIEETRGDLKQAQSRAISAVHGLDTLYGTVVGSNEAIDELVIAADTAVQEANEAVYGVESMHEQTLDAIERASQTLRAARARLQRALATGAPPAEVERLAEAIAETRRAMLEMADAADEERAAVQAAKNATRVATKTLDMLEQLTYLRPQGVSLQMNMDAIDNARERGAEAARKVARAKERAAAARARTLLAQIDVATAGADPCAQHIYDGIVAYYMQSDAETVARLREDGHGYGDIALALAQAKRLPGESPAYIAEHGRGMSQSLVDYVKDQGGSLRNANVFLQFLANAILNQQVQQDAAPGDVAISAEHAAP